MPSSTNTSRPTKNDIDEQLKRIRSMQCYHGLRSRAEMEAVMEKSGEKGTYCIRMIKSKPTDLVITLCMGKNVPCAHIPITYNQQAKVWEVPFHARTTAVGKSKSSTKTEGGGPSVATSQARRKNAVYGVIEELLKTYKRRALHDGVMLTRILPRPKWLISKSCIKYNVNDFLGKGFYCQVFKGYLARTQPRTQVAIKMLHEEDDAGPLSDRDKDEGRDAMFREARLMAKCKHKNVILFHGIQCDEPPIMIVMEFCPGGSLENHLQNLKEEITVGERILYCFEAARGMRYLHKYQIIHRDLATRNCLISSTGLIKISDFGLSRMLAELADVSVKNIPLRWMAPETMMKTPLFSTKSDVWAFGVLMYEVFNLGIKPWADEDNVKKISADIRHGRMPPAPERAPLIIQNLISSCWRETVADRPDFRKLVKDIHMTQMDAALRFPRNALLTVNKLPGVVRDGEPSVSMENALDEKSLAIHNGEDWNPPPSRGTSDETVSRESRESHEKVSSAEDIGKRDVRTPRRHKPLATQYEKK